MKNQFDRILKMSIVSWITFIILGIFLVLKAELTLQIISYIVGGTLLLAIIPVTKSLLDKDAKSLGFSFITELFMIASGLIIILNPNLIASIIPILIGIIMIINGVSKIQFAAILKSENINNWFFTLLLAIIITCCGIIFVVNPFGGAVAITKMIGICIIIYSIIDMMDFLVIHKNVKDVKKEINGMKKDMEKEIKIIEEEK